MFDTTYDAINKATYVFLSIMRINCIIHMTLRPWSYQPTSAFMKIDSANSKTESLDKCRNCVNLLLVWLRGLLEEMYLM